MSLPRRSVYRAGVRAGMVAWLLVDEDTHAVNTGNAR